MPLPIWRQILISNRTSLEEMHTILQVSFGWLDEHLYLFIDANKNMYAPEDAEMDNALAPEDTYISELLEKAGDTCKYTYDLGDDWTHTIELIEILPHNEFINLPIVVNGLNACPPEDCGGAPGYAELLKVMSNKKHPQYKQTKEWLGGEFDPHVFDVNAPTLMLHPEIMQQLGLSDDFFEGLIDEDEEDDNEDK